MTILPQARRPRLGGPWRMRPTTYRAIRDLAEFEVPREFCGLLEVVPHDSFNYLCLRPVHNRAEAENEYLVDADEHLTAIAGGADVVGVVHSHVSTSPGLSEIDLAMSVPGYIYGVYSIRFDMLKLWEVVRGLPIPVEVEIDDD